MEITFTATSTTISMTQKAYATYVHKKRRTQGTQEHSHRRKTTPKARRSQQGRDIVSGSKKCIGTKEKIEKEKREYTQQGKQSHAERAGREQERREIRKHVRVYECQCEESQEAIH